MSFVEQAATAGANFTARVTDTGKTILLTGVFSSAKEASGTLRFTGTLEGCGAFDRTVKWTAQNVPLPPTETPTAVPPTNTPTLTPTATEPALSPTETQPQPTIDSRNIAPDLLPLVSAIRKTREATMFRLEQELSLSGTSTLSSSEQHEYSHPNRHTIIKGARASVYGVDPNKGLEYIFVDGKGYVHGLARMLGASENEWYVLDSIPHGTLDTHPLSVLDAVSVNPDVWSRYERARSNVPFDGQ
ncbi:MAG: hypothetical protein HY741_21195 [Chloroflexi bacterium]|nr:hypothetical protein [Chloroflexota bacterium]